MKERRVMIAAIFFTVMITGCHVLQSQTAIDYNNQIVDIQGDVINSMLDLGKSFDSRDVVIMKSSLEGFLNAANQAEKKLNQMTPMVDDEGMKDAAAELFSFYKVLASSSMTRMVEILCQAEISEADIAELDEISANIEKTETVLDEIFSSAQERFAKKHDFSINENELQKQVDSM